MHKSRKRGLIFFGVLAIVLIGFQIYGYFIKHQSIDFEMILSALSLVIFCYYYPITSRTSHDLHRGE